MYNKNLAKYYDIMYSNKDYAFEASIIRKYCENKKKLIDVGCGTLNHSLLLKNEFDEICGIDISYEMIQIAKKKITDGNIQNINALNSDISAIGSQLYDCGISMFNVINHILSLKELINFFENFRRILKKDAILIFDSWNEAAAISDPPIESFKSTSFKDLTINSTSKPQNHILDSTINLEYEHLIYDKDIQIDKFSLLLNHRLWPKFIIEEILNDLNFKKVKCFSLKNNLLQEPSLNNYKITYIYIKC